MAPEVVVGSGSVVARYLEARNVDQIVVFAAVAAVVVIVVLLILRAVRREPEGQARPLGPARLGPSWAPAEPEEGEGPLIDASSRQSRAQEISRQTDVQLDAVRTVVTAWDEYLTVLGLASLPADHRYQVYDPYVPPVAERGADGRPVPDRLRVARDVARRTVVSQTDAMVVLDADAELLRDPQHAERAPDRQDTGSERSDR